VIKSDGGSTSYYQLPEGATELNDLIEFKKMSFALGNVFKACYRLGEKEGADLLYDLNKIVFFANRMIEQEKKRQVTPDRPKFKLKDLLGPMTKEETVVLNDWERYNKKLMRERLDTSKWHYVETFDDPDLDLFAYWDESQMYRTEKE
jgi:hypothetical protein